SGARSPRAAAQSCRRIAAAAPRNDRAALGETAELSAAPPASGIPGWAEPSSRGKQSRQKATVRLRRGLRLAAAPVVAGRGTRRSSLTVCNLCYLGGRTPAMPSVPSQRFAPLVGEPSGLLARRADAGIVETMSRRRNAARGLEGRRIMMRIAETGH